MLSRRFGAIECFELAADGVVTAEEVHEDLQVPRAVPQRTIVHAASGGADPVDQRDVPLRARRVGDDRQHGLLVHAREGTQPVGDAEHVLLGDEQVGREAAGTAAAVDRERGGHRAPVLHGKLVVTHAVLVELDAAALGVPRLQRGQLVAEPAAPIAQPGPVVHRVAEVRELPVDDAGDRPALGHEVSRARVALHEHRSAGRSRRVGSQPGTCVPHQGVEIVDPVVGQAGPHLEVEHRVLLRCARRANPGRSSVSTSIAWRSAERVDERAEGRPPLALVELVEAPCPGTRSISSAAPPGARPSTRGTGTGACSSARYTTASFAGEISVPVNDPPDSHRTTSARVPLFVTSTSTSQSSRDPPTAGCSIATTRPLAVSSTQARMASSTRRTRQDQTSPSVPARASSSPICRRRKADHWWSGHASWSSPHASMPLIDQRMRLCQHTPCTPEIGIAIRLTLSPSTASVAALGVDRIDEDTPHEPVVGIALAYASCRDTSRLAHAVEHEEPTRTGAEERGVGRRRAGDVAAAPAVALPRLRRAGATTTGRASRSSRWGSPRRAARASR